MFTRARNVWIELACFFAVGRKGYSTYTFSSLQFDDHQVGFIITILAYIPTDVDIVGHYAVILKTGFISFQSNFLLQQTFEAS